MFLNYNYIDFKQFQIVILLISPLKILPYLSSKQEQRKIRRKKIYFSTRSLKAVSTLLKKKCNDMRATVMTTIVVYIYCKTMSHVGPKSICLYLANSYREMNLAKSIYQRYGTMKKGYFEKENERGRKEKKIVKRRTMTHLKNWRISLNSYNIFLLRILAVSIQYVKILKKDMKKKRDEIFN